jgi:hypothetical protein
MGRSCGRGMDEPTLEHRCRLWLKNRQSSHPGPFGVPLVPQASYPEAPWKSPSGQPVNQKQCNETSRAGTRRRVHGPPRAKNLTV